MGQGFKTNRFPLSLTLVVMTLAAALLAWPAYGMAQLVAEPSFPGVALVIFAGACVWASGILGLLPVAWTSRRGIMPTALACFLGMGIRLATCLGAAMVAVHGNYLPGRPTAAALAVFYLPMLLIEVGFMGHYLWHQSDIRQPTSDSSPDIPPAKVLA